MDLAYADKLAKDNNGVKYLVVRLDLFDRTVDAKKMKTKDSKETVRVFLTMITRKIRPKKIWVDKGTEFAGEFKKLCKAEGIQIYSTMSETKAAFVERTKRSPKNILYRYLEDNGYKYIHKSTQVVTTLASRRKRSIDLIPRIVEISDSCPFFTANQYENLENPRLKLEKHFAFGSITLPLGRVIGHSVHTIILNVLQFFPKNIQHTQKRTNTTNLSLVIFFRKS